MSADTTPRMPYYGDFPVNEVHCQSLRAIVSRVTEVNDHDETDGRGPVYALAFRLATFGLPNQLIESILSDVVCQVRRDFG